jgi:hypothetical protein
MVRGGAGAAPAEVPSMGFRRIVSALAASALLALGPAAVEAEQPNNTPRTAFALSGTVAGDIDAAPPNLGAGRQVFYSFEYPGGSTVTIDVDITPGDPASAPHAGFHVYGPTGGKLYAQGAQTGTHPSHEAQLSSPEAGTYLLEIYNYNVTPIHYVAAATGLPPQPTGPPRPTATPLSAGAIGAPPAAAPAEIEPTATPVPVGLNVAPDRPTDLLAPSSAPLPGNPSGSFHYFRFTYPGDGSTDQIDLEVGPSDPQTVEAAGFVVYGPVPGREYARGGRQDGASVTHSTVLVTNEPGTYLVQVYSYNPRLIAYRLTLTTPTPTPGR